MRMLSSAKHWSAITLGFVLSAPAFASVPPSPAIPFKSSMEGEGDPVRIMASFLVCIAVLAVAIYLLRKKLKGVPRNGTTAIKVLESRKLGPHASLHVVEVAGKTYLLAETSQTINRIDVLEQADLQEQVQ